MGELLAFLGISLLVIVTPGQDTALTIRNTLLGGRRGGISTALGVATGQTVWALAASAGVAALIVASEPGFVALRVVGAAYLVLLGVQALRSAVRGEHRPSAGADDGAAHGPGSRPAYRQGALSNLANPKMAVFFTSLLPQFAPHGEAAFFGLLALGLVFVALTLAWLVAYAIVVARASELLLRPRVRRALDALTGTVLVALGLRLASSER